MADAGIQEETRPTSAVPWWRRRLPLIALQLALLAAVWWILKIDATIVAAIGAAIVISGAVPERYEGLVSGLGMLGLAALVYFYYGQRPLALVLLIFGVLRGVAGMAELRRVGAPVSG